MAYCLPSAIRLVLAPDGDESRDSATAASMSDAELAAAIVDADAQIDAALGEVNTVPFNPVPPVVAGLSRDIAAWLATLTYKRGSNIPAENPVRLRYERAVAMLTALGKGDSTIGVPSGDATANVVNIVPWADTFWPGYGFGQGSVQ